MWDGFLISLFLSFVDLQNVDIITTCTARKAHVDVVKDGWVKQGVHINGLGGVTIGKTELEFSLLDRSRIVVEYFDQCVIEGEIQRYPKEIARSKVYAELHELIIGAKKGRASESDIILYDSVGIGLEDYSVLRLTYELAMRYDLGQDMNMAPVLTDPKNLISVLK